MVAIDLNARHVLTLIVASLLIEYTQGLVVIP
jgi:hypothetical protein